MENKELELLLTNYIENLKMQPHPEGGYYVQTFASSSCVRHDPMSELDTNLRSAITSIYYLLPPGQISKFHRLKSDEIWYFHAGYPLNIHVIDKNGNYTIKKLGDDIASGEQLQQIVESGSWFGANLADDDNKFSLVGCAVAPGFLFSEFELANRAELLKQFPQHTSIIEKLT